MNNTTTPPSTTLPDYFFVINDIITYILLTFTIVTLPFTLFVLAVLIRYRNDKEFSVWRWIVYYLIIEKSISVRILSHLCDRWIYGHCRTIKRLHRSGVSRSRLADWILHLVRSCARSCLYRRIVWHSRLSRLDNNIVSVKSNDGDRVSGIFFNGNIFSLTKRISFELNVDCILPTA